MRMVLACRSSWFCRRRCIHIHIYIYIYVYVYVYVYIYIVCLQFFFLIL